VSARTPGDCADTQGVSLADTQPYVEPEQIVIGSESSTSVSSGGIPAVLAGFTPTVASITEQLSLEILESSDNRPKRLDGSSWFGDFLSSLPRCTRRKL